MPDLWTYRARTISVHDGDTLTALIDLGFTATVTVTLRLDGVHAPELRQPGGPETRAELARRTLAIPSEWPLLLRSRRVRDDSHEVQTLGRYVATIWTPGQDTTINQDLEEWIIAQGYPGGIGS